MTITRGPDDWTADRVQRFWDYYASHESLHGTYFGATAGAAVVHLLDLIGVLRGRVLDFGCGPGLILEHLCRRDVEGYGVDSSEQSVLNAGRRCQGLPGFRDVQRVDNGPTPWPDGWFDLILCCETVEHVTPAIAAAIYAEQWRLLKPGGHLLITTPHSENLQALMTFCPFCDSEFHGWQHLRSITPASLRAELMAAGFDVQQCQAIDLLSFDPPATLTRAPRLRRLISWTWRQALRLQGAIAPAAARRTELWLRTFPGPHLIALAQKRH
ncbi:MAG: methyltransferase domain-containing protein [Planctomycetaceae bacterium]|nr:methyltransferase domain-containing protein [Planctomycetaceae bacterium]